MKRLISLLLPVFMMVSMTACSKNADPVQTEMQETTTAQTEAAEEISGGFTVSGTKLLDANGNEFIFRGINHSHAWFAQYDGEALDAIAATGANSVRIVLANGIQWQTDTVDTVRKLIDMCKQRKLIAVLEVHDGTGDDSVETLEGTSG